MEHDRLSALLRDMAALPEFAGIAHPSPTMCGASGNTPLHVMARRGDRDAVRCLLESGGDPNAAGEHGRTPLHEALESKHVQVARMLVAAGSGLDAADRNGVTAREMIRAVPLWEGES
jgi:ankyrin repeat protein